MPRMFLDDACMPARECAVRSREAGIPVRKASEGGGEAGDTAIELVVVRADDQPAESLHCGHGGRVRVFLVELRVKGCLV